MGFLPMTALRMGFLHYTRLKTGIFLMAALSKGVLQYTQLKTGILPKTIKSIKANTPCAAMCSRAAYAKPRLSAALHQ